MDLMGRANGFMATKLKRFSEELAEKYPENDIEDIVSGFLKDTYGPALDMADVLVEKDRPVLLFIGREDCAICRRSLPELEKFLSAHKELELVKIDYSDKRGLLYHMINQDEKGLLPMIALIFSGDIKMVFTGVCIHPDVYEKYYVEI